MIELVLLFVSLLMYKYIDFKTKIAEVRIRNGQPFNGCHYYCYCYSKYVAQLKSEKFTFPLLWQGLNVSSRPQRIRHNSLTK
jgi:hypothetical protein